MNAACNSTHGSYVCTCKPGYVENGRDCAGTVNRVKNLWNLFEPDDMYFFWLSNAFCINTQSSYNCPCNPSYVGDGFNCEGAFYFFHDCQFVQDRLGLNHCRSGGHFWPNEGNLSSHQVYLKFTSFFQCAVRKREFGYPAIENLWVNFPYKS